MPRFKLTIAYVGTHLHGWQTQQASKKTSHTATSTHRKLTTVQGELERIAQKVTGELIRIHGSGRTDAGVHAEAQIAHMDVSEKHAHIDWQRAFNAQLSSDIAVLECQRVHDTFHARFDAIKKQYTYRLWGYRRVTPPQLAPMVWSPGALNVIAMIEAAQHLMGTHDFASFQNAGTDISSTIRTISAISYSFVPWVPMAHLLHNPTYAAMMPFMHKSYSVTKEVPYTLLYDAQGIPRSIDAPIEIQWTFEADGFLKQMVRNLMGLLVSVGRGKQKADAIPSILAACSREHGAVTAPPQGLTMTRVYYPKTLAPLNS